MKNKYIGSNFDEFLQEEGLLAETKAAAIKRVIAYQARPPSLSPRRYSQTGQGFRSGEAGGSGRIPAQLIAHTLFYFTKSDDLVLCTLSSDLRSLSFAPCPLNV